MDLRKVDLSKSIDGGNIDVNLKGINWITMFYPNNPNLEADNIKFAVNILKNDNQPKMLITDYQFISVFLNKYDNSVTRFWYDFHGYPTKENPYFYYWKNLVIQRLLDNKIKHNVKNGPLALAHYDGLMKAMDKNSREILSESEDLTKNYKEELNSEK